LETASEMDKVLEQKVEKQKEETRSDGKSGVAKVL
jgi:hypothetical protein